MSKCRCSSNTSLLFQLNFQSTAPRTHVDLFVSSLISTGRNWDSPHLWNLLGLYRISTTVWHVAFSQPAIWDTDFKARDQCRLTDCLLQISEEWANNFPPQGLFFLTTMCKVKTSSASPKMSPTPHPRSKHVKYKYLEWIHHLDNLRRTGLRLFKCFFWNLKARVSLLAYGGGHKEKCQSLLCCKRVRAETPEQRQEVVTGIYSHFPAQNTTCKGSSQ